MMKSQTPNVQTPKNSGAPQASWFLNFEISLEFGRLEFGVLPAQ